MTVNTIYFVLIIISLLFL